MRDARRHMCVRLVIPQRPAAHPLKQTILKQDSTSSVSLFFFFLFFFFVRLFVLFRHQMRKCEVENNEHVLCSIVPKGHSPSETITGTFLLALAPPFDSFSFFCSFLGFQELRKQNTIMFLSKVNSPRQQRTITSHLYLLVQNSTLIFRAFCIKCSE